MNGQRPNKHKTFHLFPTFLARLINSCSNNTFFKQFATMLTGNLIAQAIGLPVAAILTRIYAPEEYGNFTLLTSLSTTLGIVGCLSYEIPIVIERDDSCAHNLALFSSSISFLFMNRPLGFISIVLQLMRILTPFS